MQGTKLPRCTLAVQLGIINSGNPAQALLFAAVVTASACLHERGVLVHIRLKDTVCTMWWQKELLSRNALRQLASFLQGKDYYTVPDFLMPINTTFSFAGQVPTLAGIANLTKLHLAFCNSPEPPDFQPLAQLTCLRDLILQCLGNSAAAECSQVIDSNSSSLQHLI